MRFYLYAFCLDEGKAKPGHEEMYVGPFEWFQITWEWLRAGDDEGNYEDHQFVLADGYWYPLVHVESDGSWRSMQPDYERGRFTDISMVSEEKYVEWVASGSTPVAQQTTERVTSDQAALDAAREAEMAWAESYEG